MLEEYHIEWSYGSSGTLEGKVRNSSSVRRQVIADLCKRNTILHNHIRCSNSVKPVNHQSTCSALDTEDHALAVLGKRERRACSAVVVEEAVEAGAVDDHVLGIENTKTERIAVSSQTAAVVGILECGVGRVWAIGCVRVWLVVS